MGCAASPKSSLPEISFTPPPFPKRTQKSGEEVEVTTAAKMLGEDRRRGIAVGWWVRICQKAEMSVPSTADTAFLILSVTHYLGRAAIFRTFTWTLQVTQIPRHSTVKSGDLDFKIPYIWVLLYETNNSRLEVRFVRKITESRCISILFWSVRLQRCKWHLACRTRGE